jgi:hypothetical protein
MSGYIVDRVQVRDPENHTWLGIESDHSDTDGDAAYEVSMGDMDGSIPYIMHLRPSHLADLGIKLLELVHGAGNIRVTVQRAGIPATETIKL